MEIIPRALNATLQKPRFRLNLSSLVRSDNRLPQEKEMIQHPVQAIEGLIDRLVYE